MNYEKIGEFIAKKRKEKKLTQKELANLIGVTDKAVSKWERGLGCPDVSILEILSKELDVSILEILKGRIIENEVIPVTELNDYVLDTVKYSKESTRDRIKNILSNIITIIIIGICSFLLIININHILYLNKPILNTMTSEKLDKIKTGTLLIKNNIDIINNNRGIYSDKDYESIVKNLNEMYNSLNNMQLLKYNEKSKITKNDFYVMEPTNNMLFIISTYKLMEKYDENIKQYTDLYMSSIVSRVYTDRGESVYTTYKYRLMNHQFELYAVDIEMEYIMNYSLYIEQEILFLTENIIKVGEINE